MFYKINIQKFKLSLMGLIILMGSSSLVMNGCESPVWKGEEALQKNILQNYKTIKIGLLKHTMSFKSKNNYFNGIEYDLFLKFLNEYNYKFEIKTYTTIKELKKALKNNEIHLTAFRGLLPEEELLSLQLVKSQIPYENTHVGIFCRKNISVDSNDELQEKSLLIPQHLISYKELFGQWIFKNGALIRTTSESNPKLLLKEVAQKKSDCGLLENLEGTYFSRDLISVEKIGQLQQVIPLYIYTQKSNHELNQLIYLWLKKETRENWLVQFLQKYQSIAFDVDELDVFQFKKDSENLYHKLKTHFTLASQMTSIPWTLIAAVAYQESKWDHTAQSPQGAVGIMQVTPETAERMKIKNPLDPRQNILGGAEYLKLLHQYFPKNISQIDRWALTLVAYNMGLGHLKDAQKIAVQKNRDPYLWKDIQEILPLMEQPEVYNKLRHGKARGTETVDFVNRVFAFNDLIQHHHN